MSNVKIIAELGVNHNGKEELAFELIDKAYLAGVDIVKFQTFNSDSLVSKKAEKAGYQVENTKTTESQFKMLKALELRQECFLRLKAYAAERGLGFMSTAFDKDSLDFLTHTLKLTTLKIASGELTNAPLLLEHAKTKKDIILSTGMASSNEIKKALEIIAFGYLRQNEQDPDAKGLEKVLTTDEAQKLLKQRVTLLHCTTRYPTPVEDANLNFIDSLHNTFQLNVGFSDHTTSVIVPALSVMKGVKIIEKHFTLDNNLEGPDHKASLEPPQFKEMVLNIREAEESLGDYNKKLTSEEEKNKRAGRRSLHVNQVVNKGEKFTKDNLIALRPGHGLTPFSYWDLLGKEAKKDYSSGELIDE